MSRTPIILDGDPGHDDAIAWVFAAADPSLDIRAVISVAGNQTIEKTTWNARRIAALLGITAPVAMGANRPLTADPVTAGKWHGESGLDGPAMPLPDRPLDALPGVERMAQVLRESDRPVTIIATGPLTNVAQLLISCPHLKEKIGRISIMGGGVTHGNWKPGAEFNIFEDPEAAWVVFHAGIPLTMCGLDVTEKALIRPSDFERILAVGNQTAKTVVGWVDFFCRFPMQLGYSGAPVHDPCAVLALTHPEIFSARDLYVDIELEGEYTRGATVADFRNLPGTRPNVTCVMDIDREKYIDLLTRALAFYNGREVPVE